MEEFLKSQQNVDDADEDALLWEQYKATGDPKVRETIILKYAPFVNYIAGRIAMTLPPNVELDDLIGYGIFGLIDAIEKFQPERNVKFKTYAQVRIHGAILDELRQKDWAPRSVRQNAKMMEKAYQVLEEKLGRMATDAEVAEYLGISINQLNDLFSKTRSAFVLSLDEVRFNDEEGYSIKDIMGSSKEELPSRQIENKEIKKILAEGISELSERERMVLTLYYFEELTLKEIGEILGVSDSRISQLHTKAILKLRAKLKKEQYIVN